METHAIILDSWALVAFLEDEPSAGKIEQTLMEAIETKTKLLMTCVNLGEAWYSIARAHSDEIADETILRAVSMGIEPVAVDWELSRQAARFKAKNSMAYADCFAAALAHNKNSSLVTGDPEFKQLEGQISILWM